uniref:Uncharacterized protein n=1 Tax=Hucho hucho TaxID=62062 RepID=A0A4W5LE86_9TELE
MPRPHHYFPDLHHLKFEIEEGTMLDGRPVRFGYNPLEFEGFSWRGYAQMSSIQVSPYLQYYIAHIAYISLWLCPPRSTALDLSHRGQLLL